MSKNGMTAAAMDWPPEVKAFAAEAGVAEYLPRVLEMTQRVFPTAQRLDVALVEDAEVENDWRIVFEVAVPMTWQEVVAAEDRWCRELFQCCPSRHAVHFNLITRRVK
jgi:hypothetical protein